MILDGIDAIKTHPLLWWTQLNNDQRAVISATRVYWSRATGAISELLNIVQSESRAVNMATKAEAVQAGLKPEVADAVEKAFPAFDFGKLLALLQKYGPGAFALLEELLAALGVFTPTPATTPPAPTP